MLAQCGYQADELPDLVDGYRLRYRDGRWRERFWRNQLRAATLRYRHPRFYGLSPCEADPARLAVQDGAVAARRRWRRRTSPVPDGTAHPAARHGPGAAARDAPGSGRTGGGAYRGRPFASAPAGIHAQQRQDLAQPTPRVRTRPRQQPSRRAPTGTAAGGHPDGCARLPVTSRTRAASPR